MIAKIQAHANAGETVMIYSYATGQGCADVRQYLILNDSNPKKVLYNIEEKLRLKSVNGLGHCYIFAIYDIQRLQSDANKIKALIAEQKEAERLTEIEARL